MYILNYSGRVFTDHMFLVLTVYASSATSFTLLLAQIYSREKINIIT